MGMISRLFKREKSLFDEAGWPTTPPPDPAGTNWGALLSSFSNMRNSPLADYHKIGDPYQVISTVNLAVDKIARSIAQVPVYIEGLNGDRIFDGPLYRLIQNPTPKQDRFAFLSSIPNSMERTGAVYLVGEGFRQINGARIPAVMYTVFGDQMGYDKESKRYYVGDKYNKKAEFPERDVIPIEYLGHQGTLESVRLEIMLLFYSLQYNINFFKNGGQLPGFFKKTGGRPLSAQRSQELEEAIALRGGREAGDQRHVPVFPDIDYVTIGTTQRDMTYLEMLKEMERRIYKAFGIPYALIDEEGTTFSNMAEAKQHFWNSKLIPLIRKIEAAFDEHATERWGWPGRVRFNLDAIPELQTNVAELAEAALKYYSMGIPFEQINERLALGFANMPEAPVLEPDEPRQLSLSMRKEIAAVEKVREAIKQHRIRMNDDALRIDKGNAIVAQMKSLEDDLYKSAKAFFVQAFRQAKEGLANALTVKADNEFVDFDVDEFMSYIMSLNWDSALISQVSGGIEKAHKAGALETVTGLGFSFALEPDRARTHMAQRSMLMRNLTDSVREEIRSVLLKAIEEGADAKVLESTLSQKFNQLQRGRARAIANTETTAAYNGGRVDAMKELKLDKKQWFHTAGQDDPREGHAMLDRSVVLMEDDFTNPLTGLQITWPGNATDASEVVHCHCTVEPVILEEDEERLLEEAARRRRDGV